MSIPTSANANMDMNTDSNTSLSHRPVARGLPSTILDRLTVPNPVPDITSQRKGSLSTSPDWLAISEENIVTWADFTYENVLGCLGDLLENPFLLPRPNAGGASAADARRAGRLRSNAVSFSRTGEKSATNAPWGVGVGEDGDGNGNGHANDCIPGFEEMPKSQTIIHDEEDVDTLVDHWVRRLVREPLKACAPMVQSRVSGVVAAPHTVTDADEDEEEEGGKGQGKGKGKGRKTANVRGTSDITFKRKGLTLKTEKGGKLLKPDWHVFLHPYDNSGDTDASTAGANDDHARNDNNNNNNNNNNNDNNNTIGHGDETSSGKGEGKGKTVLVIGESKCSSKWHSGGFLGEDKSKEGGKGRTRMRMKMKTETWLWPWRQLLTYCVAARTRYGFLISPEEVVVVRVSTVAPDDDSQNSDTMMAPCEEGRREDEGGWENATQDDGMAQKVDSDFTPSSPSSSSSFSSPPEAMSRTPQEEEEEEEEDIGTAETARPKPGQQPTYQIERLSIPWSNHGKGSLTVSLAIVALGLLAINDEHREIRHVEDVRGLNVWWEEYGKPGWKHHATMMPAYRRDDLPAGATVMTRRPGLDRADRPSPSPSPSTSIDTQVTRENAIQHAQVRRSPRRGRRATLI
ncbi:hypothetical protein MKZ38_003281 [Zalerion maritima]|uniref:Uncharacterized protein n=1 Tax=Zalerion maritima TaxID=339359 RepID=A0AAD5RN13_9PEZI|nr:hypothetical protein MKZ38_003281 [Zalerion maritima]